MLSKGDIPKLQKLFNVKLCVRALLEAGKIQIPRKYRWSFSLISYILTVTGHINCPILLCVIPSGFEM